MSYEITQKLKVVNPNADADQLKGPYASIQDALTITANLRELGRTVYIVENPIYDITNSYFIGGTVVEYWFKDGIADADLVVKIPDIPEIILDDIPVENSQNPISSGGVYTALESIALQPEVSNYIERLKEVGTILPYSKALIFNDFVTTAKQYGFFDKIKMYLPFEGKDLTGALVKFIVDDSNQSSLVIVNPSSSLTYNVKTKITLRDNNINKSYLKTGFIPVNNGVAKENLSLGIVVSDNIFSGESIVVSDNTFTIQATSRALGQGYKYSLATITGGIRSNVVSYPNSTDFYGYLNGNNMTNELIGGDILQGELTGELEIFRALNDNNYIPVNASISGFIIGQGLSKIETSQLATILKETHERLGSLPTKGIITLFAGDSNTAGVGVDFQYQRWSTQVNASLGGIELNVGVPSSHFLQDVIFDFGVKGGYNRLQSTLDQDINNVIIMYGTNDMNKTDYSSQTLIDFKNLLGLFIDQQKSKGRKVTVNSIPYSTVPSLSKLLEWRDGAAEVAKSKNVNFVDLVYPFLDDIDNGIPFSTYSADQLHYNLLGQNKIARSVISVLNNQLFREPVLNFPTILPGESEYVDVTIKNITKENSIAGFNFPEAVDLELIPTAQIIGNDTVRVKLYNPTNLAIDMPATKILIKILIN